MANERMNAYPSLSLSHVILKASLWAFRLLTGGGVAKGCPGTIPPARGIYLVGSWALRLRSSGCACSPIDPNSEIELFDISGRKLPQTIQERRQRETRN
jgi:hypothetical protein